MKYYHCNVAFILILGCLLCLTACGGGGGGDSVLKPSLGQPDQPSAPDVPYLQFGELNEADAITDGDFSLWAVDSRTVSLVPEMQERLSMERLERDGQTILMIKASDAADFTTACMVLHFDPTEADPVGITPGDFLGTEDNKLCRMQVFEDGHVDIAIGRLPDVGLADGIIAEVAVENSAYASSRHVSVTAMRAYDEVDIDITSGSMDGNLQFYANLIGDVNDNGIANVQDSTDLYDLLGESGWTTEGSEYSETWFMNYSARSKYDENDTILRRDLSTDEDGIADSEDRDDYYCWDNNGCGISHYKIQVRRTTPPVRDWTDLGVVTGTANDTFIDCTNGVRGFKSKNISGFTTLTWVADLPAQTITADKHYDFRVRPYDYEYEFVDNNYVDESDPGTYWSNAVSYTYDITPPTFTYGMATPSGSDLTVGKGVVNLSWPIITDMRYRGFGYRVYAMSGDQRYISASTFFNSSNLVKSTTDTSWEFRPVDNTAWTDWTVGVRARDNLGNEDTNTVRVLLQYSLTEDETAPNSSGSAGTGIHTAYPKESTWNTVVIKPYGWSDHVYKDATAGNRVVTLNTWYSTTDPTGLEFEEWADEKNGTYAMEEPPTVSSNSPHEAYELSGLSADTLYYIIVQGEDSYGNVDDNMAATSVRTYPSVDTQAPTWVDDEGVYELTWNEDRDGFLIYYGDAIDQSPPIRFEIYYSDSDPEDSVDLDTWINQAEDEEVIKTTNGASNGSPFEITPVDKGECYYVYVRARDTATTTHWTTNTNYSSIVTSKYDVEPFVISDNQVTKRIPYGTWYDYCWGDSFIAAVYDDITHIIYFMYFTGTNWYIEPLDTTNWTDSGYIYCAETLAVAFCQDGTAGIAFVSADPDDDWATQDSPVKVSSDATPATGEVYFTKRNEMVAFGSSWIDEDPRWSTPELVHGSNVHCLSLAFLDEMNGEEEYTPAIILSPTGQDRDDPEDPEEPDTNGQLYYYFKNTSLNPDQWIWTAVTTFETGSQAVDAHIIRGHDVGSGVHYPIVVMQESVSNGGDAYFWEASNPVGLTWNTVETIPGYGHDFIQVALGATGEYYVYKSGAIAHRNSSDTWTEVRDFDGGIEAGDRYILGGLALGTSYTSESNYQLFTGDTWFQYEAFKLYDVEYESPVGLQQLVEIDDYLLNSGRQWKILPYWSGDPQVSNLILEQKVVEIETPNGMVYGSTRSLMIASE